MCLLCSLLLVYPLKCFKQPLPAVMSEVLFWSSTDAVLGGQDTWLLLAIN